MLSISSQDTLRVCKAFKNKTLQFTSQKPFSYWTNVKSLTCSPLFNGLKTEDSFCQYVFSQYCIGVHLTIK